MTTATKEITNSQNVIDSRDVIERIAKLQGAEDEQAELKLLQALEEEANGAENWQYGVMLIRDSYFTEYAKELCRDIGDLPKELPWYIESNID